MAARTFARGCLQSTHPPPTARAFLQLASRRSLPILDFLAPRVSLPQDASRSILRSLPRCTSRSFATTTSRRETVTVYNPRNDDNGNEMHIDITPRASNRLKEIMAKDANPNLALRITVESGGCHGFQYLMSLTTLPSLSQLSSSSSPIPEEEGAPALDTSSADPNEMLSKSSTSSSSNIFSSSSSPAEAQINEDDTVFKATDGSEAKVVMDGPSLELLKGSKIDYTMELIGSQFKIVDNPLATSSCGCGTSFDIKA